MLTRRNLLLLLMLGPTVGWAANAGGQSLVLQWSRRGRVTDWVVLDQEVFVLGPPLTVYDVVTGQERRRARMKGDSMAPTQMPAMTIDGSALVMGRFHDGDGILACLDTATLRVRWERRYKWPRSRWDYHAGFSLAIRGDAVYAVFTGHTGDNLAKFDLVSGNVTWSAHVEIFIMESPIMLRGDQMLVRSQVDPFYPDGYGYYHAVDPATGAVLWRIRLDGIASISEDAPLVTGKFAYVTTSGPRPPDVHFYTIDLERGAIASHRIMRNLSQPFAYDSETLYFGSNRPAAYNTSTREIVWQTKIVPPGTIGANIAAYGVLDRAAGRIYLGEYRNDLYVLSAADGSILDKINLRGSYLDPIKGIHPGYGVERLQLVGDRLFVGTPDGSLLVFRRP